MQRKSLIIAGTDTDAGKTMVSAAILKQYAPLNKDLHYWKPVQTGYPQDDDAATVQRLSGCDRVLRGLVFRRPLSPHLAAELEHKTIDPDTIPISRNDIDHHLIVEGAGGLLVPLTRQVLWIDVIEKLKSPVLLVARTTVGTINHTLLSVEALQRRNIPVIGIAFFGPVNDIATDNIHTVRDLTGLPVLGPLQPGSTTEIDRDGLLRPFLLA